MLVFRKPSAEVVDGFLKGQSKFDFTYPEVGCHGGPASRGLRRGPDSGQAR